MEGKGRFSAHLLSGSTDWLFWLLYDTEESGIFHRLAGQPGKPKEYSGHRFPFNHCSWVGSLKLSFMNEIEMYIGSFTGEVQERLKTVYSIVREKAPGQMKA